MLLALLFWSMAQASILVCNYIMPKISSSVNVNWLFSNTSVIIHLLQKTLSLLVHLTDLSVPHLLQISFLFTQLSIVFIVNSFILVCRGKFSLTTWIPTYIIFVFMNLVGDEWVEHSESKTTDLQSVLLPLQYNLPCIIIVKYFPIHNTQYLELGKHCFNGTNDRIWTCNLWFWRPLHFQLCYTRIIGWWSGARTHDLSVNSRLFCQLNYPPMFQ